MKGTRMICIFSICLRFIYFSIYCSSFLACFLFISHFWRCSDSVKTSVIHLSFALPATHLPAVFPFKLCDIPKLHRFTNCFPCKLCPILRVCGLWEHMGTDICNVTLYFRYQVPYLYTRICNAPLQAMPKFFSAVSSQEKGIQKLETLRNLALLLFSFVWC